MLCDHEGKALEDTTVCFSVNFRWGGTIDKLAFYPEENFISKVFLNVVVLILLVKRCLVALLFLLPELFPFLV